MATESLCESCDHIFACQADKPPKDRTRVVDQDGKVSWCTRYVEAVYEEDE